MFIFFSITATVSQHYDSCIEHLKYCIAMVLEKITLNNIPYCLITLASLKSFSLKENMKLMFFLLGPKDKFTNIEKSAN